MTAMTEHAQTEDSDHLGDLCEAIVCLKTPEEARAFMEDLTTPAEMRALSERWHVAQILARGKHSYRAIQERTGVSTTTIGRVARFLMNEPHQGYRLVLERLKRNTGRDDRKIKSSSSKKGTSG